MIARARRSGENVSDFSAKKCRQVVFATGRGAAGNCHVKRQSVIAAATKSTRCAITHCCASAPAETMAAGVRLASIAAAAQRARCAIAALFAPRPAEAGALRCERGAAALACYLTPARSSASNLASQFRVPSGSGGAVLTGTVRELRQNLHDIENAAFFARFSRFPDRASRDAHAPTCVCTRAHIREEKPRTREPIFIIHIIHNVVGSRAVLVWFSSEPAMPHLPMNGGFARFSNILASGYAAALASRAAIGRGMGVKRGRGRETFGDFGRDRRGAGLEVGLGLVLELGADRRGGNGGFPPFCPVGAGRVGRPMLEGWPERRGNAGLSSLAPLPVGLERAAPWAGRQGGSRGPSAPPCAPARLGPAPSRVARQSGRIWIDLRPEAIRGGCAAPAGGRQTGGCTAGSGVRWFPAARRWMRATGRGEAAAGLDFRQALRRSGHANAGAADVN